MPPTYEEYLEAQSQLEQQPTAISFEKLQQCSEVFTKTLSAYDTSRGGALVPPPAFGPKLPLRRNQPSVIDKIKVKELRTKYRYKMAMSTVENAGKFLAEKWQQLEPHHGRRQALMLAVAMISSSPLPGNIAEIIAAAEDTRGVRTYFKKDLQECVSKGWVTIGGGPCNEGQHCGGTRVFIDGSGKITKGPPSLEGRKPRQGAKPSGSIKPEARSVEEPNPIPKNPEAQATTAEEKSPRVSKAAVKIDKDDAAKINTRSKDLGIDNPSDIANLVGALDDAKITVYTADSDSNAGLLVNVDHPSYSAIRTIDKDEYGNRFIKNDSFFTKQDKTGTGLGSLVFSDQVAWAREKGFTYIKTDAERSARMNGYYTWARLGYDAPLDDQHLDPRVVQLAEQAFPEATTVQDIMATPEGKDWWKENGSNIMGAVFNLAEGSLSNQILEDYLQERQGRERKRTQA